MNRTEWHDAADASYEERIRTYTLTELEDVYAHVDRQTYPQRFDAVYREVERRLRELDAQGRIAEAQDVVKAGILRRSWATIIDTFVQALIVCALVVVWWAGGALVASFAETEEDLLPPMERPQTSPFMVFVQGVVQGKPEALKDTRHWGLVGLALLGTVLYKALLVVPAWVRSGATPGMREVGVRLVAVQDGAPPGVGRALVRFFGQYLLFVLTLGLSALWALWDRRAQALHDKLAGTRVIRVTRSWEKPAEAGLLDD